MQFRVIVVTDPQIHTHKQTGPITIHCAAASAQCNTKLGRNLHQLKKTSVSRVMLKLYTTILVLIFLTEILIKNKFFFPFHSDIVEVH